MGRPPQIDTMLVASARRIVCRRALSVTHLSPPVVIQASALCKLPEAPWKGDGNATRHASNLQRDGTAVVSDKVLRDWESIARPSDGTASPAIPPPGRSKARGPEHFVPPTFPEADMCNPPGVTDDDLCAFLFERWELHGGPKGRGKNWNPRRRLYKLQRAMQVDGVWPLESLSPDARLAEKEKLLHTIHRIAANRLPELTKDEDGGFTDIELVRRVRSVSMLAALSHRELLEEVHPEPQRRKPPPAHRRRHDNSRPRVDRATLGASLDQRK